MDYSLATREVYWQIPTSFQIAMYGMMIIAFAVLGYGILQKTRFVLNGQGYKSLLPEKLNWKNFFQTIFSFCLGHAFCTHIST